MGNKLKNLLAIAPQAFKPLPNETYDACDCRDPLVREMAAAAGKPLPPVNLRTLPRTELRVWLVFSAERALYDPLYRNVFNEIEKLIRHDKETRC